MTFSSALLYNRQQVITCRRFHTKSKLQVITCRRFYRKIQNYINSNKICKYICLATLTVAQEIGIYRNILKTQIKNNKTSCCDVVETRRMALAG